MIDADSGEVRRLTVAWESALQLRTLKSRPRPCGYWLAPSENEAVRRLRLLGVEVRQLDELGELRAEGYREIGREPVAGGAEANGGGATRLKVQMQPALLDARRRRLLRLARAAARPPRRRRARARGAGELRRQRRHRRPRRRSAYSRQARDPHDAGAVASRLCKERGGGADTTSTPQGRARAWTSKRPCRPPPSTRARRDGSTGIACRCG